MIKAVIFDMDGVLVDNRDAHIEAFLILCKRHNHTLSRIEVLKQFGKGNEEIIPAIFTISY